MAQTGNTGTAENYNPGERVTPIVYPSSDVIDDRLGRGEYNLVYAHAGEAKPDGIKPRYIGPEKRCGFCSCLGAGHSRDVS
ncbi:MAG: hypothetical protein ABH817_01515 [archaeon]